MPVIQASTWEVVTEGGTAPVSITGRHKPLVDLLTKALNEEIEHIKSRANNEVTDAVGMAEYNKTYTRTYTEYSRNEPMYEMSDYTANISDI